MASGGSRQDRTKRYARREDLGLTPSEFAVLQRLDAPRKIQDFLDDRVAQNHELTGDTALSVREVLRQRHAHCIEGAMLAACALWIQGEPPLLMYLSAVRDFDHAITLFRRHGCWGAISKTNHAPLRYRDPVYRSLRELAMSYFHEYTNRRGQKTLRSYSRTFDLRRVDPELWVTNPKNCWGVVERLLDTRHYPLISTRQERGLRVSGPFVRKSFDLPQYPHPGKRT
ncbi:MAG: hypothetical protein KJ025_11795 [Burkholderiales bacterium]|nr:hypothetical protein [Burkholderiales bacterium]